MEPLTTLSDPTVATPAATPERADGPVCTPEEALVCLLTATQELNTAPDLASGLRAVAETVRQFFDYSSFGVLLLDERGRELRYVFAQGMHPGVAEHWRFGLGQGLVGTVARTGDGVVVDDVAADPRFIRTDDTTRAEAVLPLKVKERVIGVLDVGAAQPHAFTPEHRQLLGFLAGHLANALETARLHQNTRALARSLSLLHELARELVSILDRRRLLGRVAELVQRIIEYDVFTVFLWNEDRQLLEPYLSVRRDGTEVRGTPALALGHGLCGTAAALRQPLRVPNVHVDPRYMRCSASNEVRSELVIPLVFEDRLLGVLDLESNEYDRFREQHEQLLSTLASSLAIALENARLYEKVRSEEQRLNDDLATARQIQTQLLPHATPWVPGLQVGVAYEPARHLAGDLYDFLPYGEGRLAIALGDVAGKSTAAALYGTFAVAVLREMAAQHRTAPAALLADMSCKLRNLGFESRFLAMAFGVYDAPTSTLRIANGGLPRPYLVRRGPEGPVVETLAVSGVPLGLLPQVRHHELEIVLEPGDVVAILSDGIEESLNGREEEFGPRRIAEVLAELADATAPEIASGIVAAVRRFTGTAPISDDRTVVVLRAIGTPK